MTSRSGLTLIELIIAIAIIAIGITAAIALQTSSLRYSSQAEIINHVTRAAEGEIEWRRQISIGTTSVGTKKCQSIMPDTIVACEVVILPCVLPAGTNEFTCIDTVISPIAYELVVNVTGTRNQQVSVRSVNTGLQYISGTGGEVGGLPWVFPDEDEEGGGPINPGGQE